MDRRGFVAVSGGVLGLLAGCLGPAEPEPEARIEAIELANHRREKGYEFTARIEDGETRLFEETRSLGSAGSGESVVVLEKPVDDPGTYTVRVDAGEHTATVDMADYLKDDTACLRLDFYLGDGTLHAEPIAYDRC
jgi:hypothetical protein